MFLLSITLLIINAFLGVGEKGVLVDINGQRGRGNGRNILHWGGEGEGIPLLTFHIRFGS